MHGIPPSATRGTERIAYRPREVAELLGVSLRTVYRLLNSKELASVKLTGRRMVFAEDFEAFVTRIKDAA